MANELTAVPKVRTDREYEYWRWRILLGTMIGYIFFYFVRKSITMAMPGLEDIGITKTTLGLFLTIHGVLYGFSRFVNGV
jgi:OPA family glycerol-3-phosphate transporter-like MFS transporter/OPA family sugar phosphate sensor protein UhpC-like MFS transporter